MEFGHRVTPVLPNSGHPGSPATPAMCPADSEPRCSFYRRRKDLPSQGKLHPSLPLTTSNSALMKLLLFSPSKKRLEKGLFLTKVTFPPCFVFSLVAAQGCASPHDPTRVNHSLPSTLWSVPGVQGMDRQGLGSAWCRWRLQTEHRTLCSTNPCCSPRVSYLGFVTLWLLSPVAVIC